MIKFQNANVDKDSCPHHIIEYTYIGLKAELVAFNATKKASENEFWFCPDTQETYYWHKEAQQFLKLGTGYSPEPPPEPTKLGTPILHDAEPYIKWDAIDHADGYHVKIYNLNDYDNPVLIGEYDTKSSPVDRSEIEAQYPDYATFGVTVTATSDTAAYTDSDPSEMFDWEVVI